MQHLQPFALFEAGSPGTLSPKQQAFLDLYTRGTWSLNPATGLVDVQGDLNCYSKNLKSFEDINFGLVEGYFSCSRNNLTTLAGCPHAVQNDFSCTFNSLTSLEGGPVSVKGGFRCTQNNLESLVGAPQKVGEEFYCHYNPLSSLDGAPLEVGTTFLTDHFELSEGLWNPQGWTWIQSHGSEEAQSLILTLPYLQPQYWLDLHRSDRQKFNALWLAYRQNPKIRSTPLWQQVEQALSGRAQSNLDDLELLGDFT